MSTPFTAYVRGLPETPSIREINIRSGPSTQYQLLFKQPIGVGGLPVLDAKPDEQGNNFQGKVYTWLKIQFPNNQTGWARDDLLELVGDGRALGYPVVAVQSFGFSLTRQAVAPSAPIPPTAAPISINPVAPPVTPATAAPIATTPATPSVTPGTAPPISINPVAPVVPPVPAVPAAPAAIAPTPSIPAAPAAPAAPAPVPAAPPAPAAAPTPSAIPTGYVNMRDGANVRSGPGSSNALVTKLARNTETTVLEVKPDQGGGVLRWVRIRAGTVEGWMREDVLRFDGSVASFGLAQPGLYPASMKDRWWVRGYEGPQGHWGWDWGARVGEPVLCGPFGGLVVKSVECSRCTPDRPSFKEHGLPLGDSRGLSDPAWNFGYGHYVIVRYLNEHLPQFARQSLAAAGLLGAHIYVIYAHLNSRAVSDNQQVAANAIIGTCGDTGNSEAAHLHLEMRASMNPADTNWAGMKKNLLDPTILFYR